ncbi:hypothetical protein BDN70DRAFT_554212 [Pholiota conissans]|uniref:Uncharacterized protein n=1 Tax=Pholiota conissans TaxID=109636 RepID=A0A9P5Z6V0_9AGAR|nr:hypothetical protein BDN70DRAFT_554212 [Pholiota conissans]
MWMPTPVLFFRLRFASSSRLDHLDDTTASGVGISPVGPLLKTLTPLDRIPSICSNPFSLFFYFSICLFRYLRLHCHVVCPLSHSLLTQVYLFFFLSYSSPPCLYLSISFHLFCACAALLTFAAIIITTDHHHQHRRRHLPPNPSDHRPPLLPTTIHIHIVSRISTIPIPNNPNSTKCLLCIVYHTYFPSPRSSNPFPGPQPSSVVPHQARFACSAIV